MDDTLSLTSGTSPSRPFARRYIPRAKQRNEHDIGHTTMLCDAITFSISQKMVHNAEQEACGNMEMQHIVEHTTSFWGGTAETARSLVALCCIAEALKRPRKFQVSYVTISTAAKARGPEPENAYSTQRQFLDIRHAASGHQHFRCQQSKPTTCCRLPTLDQPKSADGYAASVAQQYSKQQITARNLFSRRNIS